MIKSWVRFTLMLLTFIMLATGCYQKPSFERAHAYFMAGQYFNAFKLFEELGLRGDPRAAYTVGYCYYYGIGVAQDEDEARTWVKIAAKKHYPPAQVALDMMLKNGEKTLPPQVLAPANADVRPIVFQPAEPIHDPIAANPIFNHPDPNVIWISSQPPHYFTLECARVITPEMEKDVKQFKQKKWKKADYRVPGQQAKTTIYGSFPSLQAAADAKAELPLYLRNHIHIRSFNHIQSALSAESKKVNS